MSATDVSLDWSPEMLDYLRRVTRELKFDWSRISDHMRDHLGSKFSSSSCQVPVDPATCRLMFARDYRFDASSSIVKAEETADVILLDAPLSTAGTAAAQSGLSTKNFENMSLDELISHVDSTEQVMKRQKEDIFRRVMNSLGIEGGNSGPNATASASDCAVREAYEEGIATRELERSKKFRHQAELEERRRLETERDALRRRFDRDEDGGEGGDPHVTKDSWYSRTSLDTVGMDDGKASKLHTAMLDAPSIYDPSVGRALTSYFETEEFEAILSQLERELDRMAVAKDEEQPPSELSEVLSFLEQTAATSNGPSTTTPNGSSVATSNGPSASTSNGPSVATSNGPSASTSNGPSAVTFNGPSASTSNGPSASTSNGPSAVTFNGPSASTSNGPSAVTFNGPSTEPSVATSIKSNSSAVSVGDKSPTAARVHLLADTTGASRPLTQRREVDKEAGLANGRMGTRRGHGQANEYASPDGDSDSDDVEGDWQAMRTRRKGEALQAATQSAAAEHKIPKSIGFWGAFGEPTVHRNAVYREQSVRWSHSNSAVLDIADATRRAAEALVSSQLDLDQSSDGDSIVVEKEEDEGVHAIIEPIDFESFTELHPVSLVADAGSFSSSSAQLVAIDSMPLPVPPALNDDEDRMAPFYAELLPIASPNDGMQPDYPPGFGQGPELVEDALEGVSVVEKSGSLVGTSGRRVKGGKLTSIMNKASKGISPSVKNKVDAAVQQQEVVNADDHHAELFSQESSPSAAQDLPIEAPLQPPLCTSSSEVDCTQKSPNWDTQLSTALQLVDLTAPLVSSFPFTAVNDRSSSGSVTFSGETLPTECIGTAQSSSRLVVVDILINKVQVSGATSASGGSDLPWIRLLCWVVAAARQHFILVAMAWGRFSGPYLWTAPSDDLVCRIAFESRSPDAVMSAADLLQLTRSTLLAPIISSDSASDHLPHHAHDHEGGATVDTVVLVKDSLSSDLFADLRAINQDISNVATLRAAAADLDYKSKAFGLLSSSHIAVSVLRDYVVREGTMAQLSALVSRAETEGLRLCGLRVAHLDSHRLFKLEQFCSIPGHAKPVLSSEVSEVCADKEHSLMVLAVAFHGCGSIPIGECSPTSSILRAIMGPEDPVLAMKTDPQSLRAVFGGPGKESNVSYPISHSAARISKEVSFWFGGRRRGGRGVQTEEPVAAAADDDDDTDAAAALDCFSAKLPLLFFGQLRLFSVGVCFSSTSLGTHSSSALSSLQSVVLQSIANSLNSVGLFASVHSYSSLLPYRRAVRSGSKGQLLCSLNAEESQALTIGIGKKSSLQFFVWRFFSSVGDSYIRRVLETIYGSTGRVTGMGAASSSPKARRTHSVLSDVWDVHLECFVASALSEEGPSPRDDDGTADTVDAAPTAVSGPTAATQQNGDMGVDGQSTAGSRLLAFELLKRLPEDDSKSHEDVGLSDMVVIQLSRRTTITDTDGDAAALWQSADLLSHLMLLLKLIPPTCQAHIVAMKGSNTNTGTRRRGGDDGAVDSLLVALRGYQILENIDFVVAEMMRPTALSASDSRRKSATSNKGVAAVQVTVARGRRACEVLFCEFPLHAIYIDLALRDVHRYVPAAKTRRGTSSAAEAPLSCDIVGATASLSSEATATGRFYVQALFPPGSFTASAVLVVPWHADGTTMTRNLGRVVSRLEKEGFELLEVKAVAAVDPALLVDLYRDNCAEYHRFEGYGMGPLESGAWGEDQYHFLKGDAVVILVRRRSAMLRLKSVIGPIFDKQLLETQYPRSLMHLLHSLHPSGRTTPGGVSTSTAPVIPFVLPTLTCRSTDRAIEVLFPEYHADAELPLKTISLNTTASSSSSAVHESVAAADEDTFGSQPLRTVPLVSRWVGACSSSSSSSISPPRGEEIVRRRRAEADMTTTHVDIAGIVVTHALLQESSLGLILEALHREELTIRNIFTSYLPGSTVKHLLQLAGASSLSMKPPLPLLTGGGDRSGPAVVIGVEGPSHAFVRFKSYALTPRSSAVPLWKLTSNDWGVLASSSSRLGKDLYRYCFEDIYGQDSLFEVRVHGALP